MLSFKKYLSVFCAIFVVLSLHGADLTQRRPTAKAWGVVDEITGTYLRFNRTNQFRPIASTTKLLTALAVVRHGNLDEWVTVSARAASQVPSKIGLKAGDRWRRRDLLQALLMQSANDAATALAESVSGSEASFCRHITHLARELGCQNTVIKKASGLPSHAQGSTIRDLAIISKKATQNKYINRILKTKRATITSKTGHVIEVKNKNRLHDDTKQGPILGKTGYTKKAKRCFAGTMNLDGRPHTIILLGSKDLWGDLKLLRGWTHQFVKALNQNKKHLRSEEVISWQKKLSSQGFNVGIIDGIWGARTQMAYLNWQEKNKHQTDGLVNR